MDAHVEGVVGHREALRRAGAERITVPQGWVCPDSSASLEAVVAVEVLGVEQHLGDLVPLVVGPTQRERHGRGRHQQPQLLVDLGAHAADAALRQEQAQVVLEAPAQGLGQAIVEVAPARPGAAALRLGEGPVQRRPGAGAPPRAAERQTKAAAAAREAAPGARARPKPSTPPRRQQHRPQPARSAGCRSVRGRAHAPRAQQPGQHAPVDVAAGDHRDHWPPARGPGPPRRAATGDARPSPRPPAWSSPAAPRWRPRARPPGPRPPRRSARGARRRGRRSRPRRRRPGSVRPGTRAGAGRRGTRRAGPARPRAARRSPGPRGAVPSARTARPVIRPPPPTGTTSVPTSGSCSRSSSASVPWPAAVRGSSKACT